jgi:hypothetical protein
MRRLRLTMILLLSLGVEAFADDQSDRQKLIGSWDLQSPAESTSAISWTFSATGHSMRIKQLEGGSKVADFECETEGTPCEIKTGGKRAMVSLWFNGPRLVEMETKGSDVVKRRFKILPASDAMEMEVIPIVPGGKTETFEFKREQLASR